MTMAELPPWMTGKGERRIRNARSRRQERERAEEVDGKTQAGSGSSWRRPEDIRSADTLEQIKFTDSKSFRITSAELQRILNNASRDGRDPVLVIDFPKDRIRIVGHIERTR